MPTQEHLRLARRAVTLAGYPPPADGAERARRRTLIEALAGELERAEQRATAAAVALLRAKADKRRQLRDGEPNAKSAHAAAHAAAFQALASAAHALEETLPADLEVSS